MFSEIFAKYFSHNFSMSVYDKLFKSFHAAHPNKSKAQQQLDVNKIWNDNKKQENGMNIILDLITELDKKASLRNLKLKNFWTNFPKISLKKSRYSQRYNCQRANEVMAIISNYENCDDVEWVEENDLDVPPSMLEPICRERNEGIGFPIVSLEDHFKNAWEENA